MSHPGHIIIRGYPNDDEHQGASEITFYTPAGMSHTEVAKRVKKLLNAQEKIYEIMSAPGVLPDE